MSGLMQQSQATSSSGTTSRCSGRRFASSKIVAILKAVFGPSLVPIYWFGAAERQGVGPGYQALCYTLSRQQRKS